MTTYLWCFRIVKNKIKILENQKKYDIVLSYFMCYNACEYKIEQMFQIQDIYAQASVHSRLRGNIYLLKDKKQCKMKTQEW